MKPTPDRPAITPNLALKQLREAVNQTQGEMADRLSLSKPYIQAVEQGTRRANNSLALKCMTIFGVWHECIRDHWTEAVDLYGEPYTHSTWQQYIALHPEPLTKDALEEALQPFITLFEAAAVTGKVRVLALTLYEMSGDLLQIQGIGDGLQRVFRERSRRKATEYTFGKLRADANIAAVLGFVDDPRRGDDDVAFRVEPAADDSQPLFTLSNIYPHPGTISERYMEKNQSTEKETR